MENIDELYEKAVKYVEGLFPKTGIWFSRDNVVKDKIKEGRIINQFNDKNLPYNTANREWVQNYIGAKIVSRGDFVEEGLNTELLISVIFSKDEFDKMIKNYQGRIVDFELNSNMDKHLLDTDTDICCKEIKAETYDRLTKILKMPEEVVTELIDEKSEKLKKDCAKEKTQAIES